MARKSQSRAYFGGRMCGNWYRMGCEEMHFLVREFYMQFRRLKQRVNNNSVKIREHRIVSLLQLCPLTISVASARWSCIFSFLVWKLVLSISWGLSVEENETVYVQVFRMILGRVINLFLYESLHVNCFHIRKSSWSNHSHCRLIFVTETNGHDSFGFSVN